VTVLDLKQGPQDTSEFYLKKIYELQVLINSNASHTSISPTPAKPHPFLIPRYVRFVNLFWFWSLVVNLSCAMEAISVQQWARRYIRITQSPRDSPHERARTRAYYAHSYSKSDISRVVSSLQARIHISLLFFFVGLLIYLANLSSAVCSAVIGVIGVTVLDYLYRTFSGFLRRESLRFTPLSSWLGLLSRMDRISQEAIQEQAPKLDSLVLTEMFETLVGDHELALFFEGIPGFCNSSIVKDPLCSLAKLREGRLSSALSKFLENTWSFNGATDLEKMRRLAICVKVVDVAQLSDVASSILDDIFPRDRHEVLRSVEIVQYLKSQGNTTNETGLCAQSIIAGIIANVQGSDDHWIALAAEQLGKSDSVIRGYLEHGIDSLLLANLIHIIRRILRASSEGNEDMAHVSCRVLPSLCDFDIRNTLPGLQHDLLALWDEFGATPDSRVHTAIRENLPYFYYFYYALTQVIDDAPTEPPVPDANPDGHSSESIPITHAGVDENPHTPFTYSPSHIMVVPPPLLSRPRSSQAIPP
jgi:hypothetical protein